MDPTRRSVDTRMPDPSVRTVSRRTFLTWARMGVIAVAGVAVFGSAPLTVDVHAKENSDKDAKEKEKNSKSKPESKSKKKKKNKTTPTAASPHAKYVVPGQDKYNCTDFTTQADAQAVLRLSPPDPNNLDRNRDGVACGGNEAFQDGVPGGFMMPPFDINPVPRT